MGGGRSSQRQFEIIVEFMERNGDLQALGSARLENVKKWNELVAILNKKSNGEPKSLDKWRKVWSDFKTNTKRKIERIQKCEGKCIELSNLEKRLITLIGIERPRKRSASNSDKDNSIKQVEKDADENEDSTKSPSLDFCGVDPKTIRQSRSTSVSSYESNTSLIPPKKPKSRTLDDDMKFMADKFLELEREREKMAHEREITRIKQNEQLLSILGRLVNVLETLTPSIQKYLDGSATGDG